MAALLCSSLSALSLSCSFTLRAARAITRPQCQQARVPSNASISRLIPTRRLSSWRCGARRKSSSVTKTDAEVLDDEDLRAGLNEALKVMLAEDDKMLEAFREKVDFLGEFFREKVDFLGEFLVQDGQVEAARFMLILRGMLDHEVYPQNEGLQGPYKKAFNTLWCLLEDSGWLLKVPGSEIPQVLRLLLSMLYLRLYNLPYLL